MDVVRERAFLAQLEEETARHPFTEDRVQHVDRELVRMELGHAAPADAHVRLLAALGEHPGPIAARPRRGLGPDRGARREVSEA